MFVAMSQNWPIDTVSLSTVCKPDVPDRKDCFEAAVQILGVLHDVSSGTLRDIIRQLFVLDRSPDFLPPSPPDVFLIDLYFLTPSPFQILYFDRMPEFLFQSYSIWYWATSNIINVHLFISHVFLLKSWPLRMNKESYGEILLPRYFPAMLVMTP
jgi:hypothetical protein